MRVSTYLDLFQYIYVYILYIYILYIHVYIMYIISIHLSVSLSPSARLCALLRICICFEPDSSIQYVSIGACAHVSQEGKAVAEAGSDVIACLSRMQFGTML
jgi:hypothetical protein